jgi:hypothetical protein
VILWDKRKIESIFPSDITTCILDVPLFYVVEENNLVWYDDVHGPYNVKSVYNMMHKITRKGVDMTSQRGLTKTLKGI